MHEFVDYAIGSWAAGTSAVFAILRAQTEEPLGLIELAIPEPGLGEVGYWVRQEARRQGVATAALRLVASCIRRQGSRPR